MYTVVVDFITWVDKERVNRGWSMRELSKRAGLSKGYVQLVLSGLRNPGNKFCVGISNAFRVPPEVILRRAGLLPQLDDLEDKSLVELMDLVNSLSHEERLIATRLLLGLMATRGDDNEEISLASADETSKSHGSSATGRKKSAPGTSEA